MYLIVHLRNFHYVFAEWSQQLIDALTIAVTIPTHDKYLHVSTPLRHTDVCSNSGYSWYVIRGSPKQDTCL